MRIHGKRKAAEWEIESAALLRLHRFSIVMIGGAIRSHSLRNLNVARLWVDGVSLVVLVVMAYPRHRVRQSLFVAALGRMIEEVICAYKNIETARITRIGVKNLSIRVLIEHAQTRTFFAGESHLF